MRTLRLLTVWGWVCIRGWVCIQGVGLHPGMGLHLGGGYASRRGICVLGVCIQGGWSAVKGLGLGRPLSLMNRMTDRCKTLPCPKLCLRAVNIMDLMHHYFYLRLSLAESALLCHKCNTACPFQMSSLSSGYFMASLSSVFHWFGSLCFVNEPLIFKVLIFVMCLEKKTTNINFLYCIKQNISWNYRP